MAKLLYNGGTFFLVPAPFAESAAAGGFYCPKYPGLMFSIEEKGEGTFMICQNCGTENDDAAAFCCSCGARLKKDAQQPVSAVPVQPAKKAPKRKMKPAVKGTIIACAAVVCAAVVFFAVGLHISSPEYAANQYMDAMKAGDWGKVYSSLDLGNSEFVNHDQFVKACSKNDKYKGIKSYTISKPTKALETAPGFGTDCLVVASDSAAQRSFLVEYTPKSEDPQFFVLTMERQPQKQLLFFDTWKASTRNFVVPTLKVAVPKGTTAELDSKTIDAKYEDKADSNYDVIIYNLRNVLKGNHDFTCTAPYLKDKTDSVDVETPDQSVEFSSASLSIKDETLKQVSAQAEKFLQDFYAAEAAHKEFSAVEGSAAISAKSLGQIQNQYEEEKSRFSNGKTEGFTKISFSNFSSTAQGRWNDCGPMISVHLNYAYSFSACSKDFVSDKLTNYIDLHRGQADMDYIFTNGKWAVDDFQNDYMSYFKD